MSEVGKKLYGTVLIKADLVGVLSQSGEPLTMNDISNHADITLLTSSNILNTRKLLGYKRRDEGGKATLATFDKTVQNESFAFDELTPRTPYTLPNQADLKGQVEDSEKNGYAIDDRKSDEDVFCVGVAIVNLIDRTHYAFSISISYYHLTD